MAVVIRNAIVDDIPTVERMMRDFRDEVSQYDYFRDDLPQDVWLFGVELSRLSTSSDLENIITLVAENQERVIGVLICEEGQYVFDKHIATVKIIVDPEWRRQGIGGELLAYIITWERENGIIKRIQAQIPAKNLDALALFTKYGFATEGKLRQTIFTKDQCVDDSVLVSLLL